MHLPEAPLFVSPHLDDAVLGCGTLIASAVRPVVVTLFAGRPAPGTPLTEWDRAAGFVAGEDVVGARREEDREALALLGAIAAWLEFRDDQYGGNEPVAAVTADLAEVVGARAAGAVFLPLGLFHADHRRASDAALAMGAGDASGRPYFVYEEPMYRRVEGERARRMELLRQRGVTLAPAAFDVAAGALARKRDALACYRSQLRALGTRSGHADALAAERYWSIA